MGALHHLGAINDVKTSNRVSPTCARVRGGGGGLSNAVLSTPGDVMVPTIRELPCGNPDSAPSPLLWVYVESSQHLRDSFQSTHH